MLHNQTIFIILISIVGCVSTSMNPASEYVKNNQQEVDTYTQNNEKELDELREKILYECYFKVVENKPLPVQKHHGLKLTGTLFLKVKNGNVLAVIYPISDKIKKQCIESNFVNYKLPNTGNLEYIYTEFLTGKKPNKNNRKELLVIPNL